MISSLVFGLIAWILPSINIGRYKRNYNKNWDIYSIISISACAIFISFQLIYSNYIVSIEDWSALMYTIGTSNLLSLILLVVTMVLNIVSVSMYRTEK